jgi:peptide-methionine (S)-S-oxide reductase
MKDIIKRSWLALAGLLMAMGPGAVEARAAQPAPSGPVARATFAAGCFWCVEEAFDKVPGVISTTSGYTGGTRKNPSYEAVSSGGTGHAESVEVAYDPAKVTYQKLLDTFWHNVDPLVKNRQFCDVGEQYRSAIFYRNETEKQLAEASMAEVQKRFKQPVQTEIVAASTFYPAEGYHQDYYKKNPLRYKFYRNGCGRDRRLAELWGASGE